MLQQFTYIYKSYKSDSKKKHIQDRILTGMCKLLWLRMNGQKAPSCVHRVHNSAFVGPAKPQTSEPTIGIPNS